MDEQSIRSCLQPQIDFVIVCNEEMGCDSTNNIDDLCDTPLYPILRNLGHWVISSCAEWKKTNFRGKRQFMLIIWR
jgi:hypothetical protein